MNSIISYPVILTNPYDFVKNGIYSVCSTIDLTFKTRDKNYIFFGRLIHVKMYREHTVLYFRNLDGNTEIVNFAGTQCTLVTKYTIPPIQTKNPQSLTHLSYYNLSTIETRLIQGYCM